VSIIYTYIYIYVCIPLDIYYGLCIYFSRNETCKVLICYYVLLVLQWPVCQFTVPFWKCCSNLHQCQPPPQRENSSNESWNHRNIECFGLEGTFRVHLAQHPCSEQGHLQLGQVAQSPVQPGLECFQGWDLHCLSGQPVPVFHHPHYKNFLPYTQSKSTLP